jgi:hypothetical protein
MPHTALSHTPLNLIEPSDFTSLRKVIDCGIAPMTAPAEIEFTPGFMKPLYRQLSLAEKLSARFLCNHKFTWPHTRTDVPLQIAYAWKAKPAEGEASFDAHQVCTCCGVMRMFDRKTFRSGDFFKWADAGAKTERQQHAFDVLATENDFGIQIAE